jgi:hypothetical protein
MNISTYPLQTLHNTLQATSRILFLLRTVLHGGENLSVSERGQPQGSHLITQTWEELS